MKFILALTLWICCISTIHAQTIKGTVKDIVNDPVSYATVVLYSLPDTTQISYSITDLEGRFELKSSKSKELLLQVSFIGYKTIYTPAVNGQTITLEEDQLALDEVVVNGTRPISKITSSGVETIVANTVLSDMGSGNDVLKRIPMVTGDDGEFEVFGRGKARIYINNREVRDPSELDNLNSTDIQNVEVISNPGSRYDATVSAVINIKTTKKQGDGFSFNARSSFYTWENSDYINQLNTNYRKGGLDLFANIYYSNVKSVQIGDISQTTSIDTLWRQSNYINGVAHSNKLNGTIGANYEINDNHQIGFRYDLKSLPQDNTLDFKLTSDVYADDVLFDKWENNELKHTSSKPTSQANLYYAGKINKLSIDFNTDYHKGESNSKSVNTEKSEAFGDRTIHSINNINNSLWATKLQLSYPIWKGELSVGSEYVDISRGDEYINDDLQGFSSRINVDETNLALFAEWQAATDIGNFSVGVRYENAAYDYIVDGIEAEDKSRKYKQWFPNASYATKIGEVGLQLNYNSKVIRPSYRELSNNLLYGNRLTIETGNPYLKPTIKQDLSFMGVWKFIQASVSYTHQKDAIAMWIDRHKEDPKVSVLTSRNIDNLPMLSAYVTVAPKFGIWKPQLSGGIQKQWLDLRSDGIDTKLDNPYLSASLNNSFELPNNFIINLDGQYAGTGNFATGYTYKDKFIVNCGVAKSFLDKSLQVKLSVSDIFNQQISAYQVIMPGTDFKNLYHYDNREISLTIRYKFNSAKSKYKGSTAGSDALNRF